MNIVKVDTLFKRDVEKRRTGTYSMTAETHKEIGKLAKLNKSHKSHVVETSIEILKNICNGKYQLIVPEPNA